MVDELLPGSEINPIHTAITQLSQLLPAWYPAQMPLFPFDAATTKNWVLFNMIGTATVGPWGASFSANLTSDETGIGAWSAD